MIISVLNQKGGVGKTTISIHLAMQLALMDFKVLLIDSDPQNSTLDWAATRANNDIDSKFTTVSINKPTIHREVKNFKDLYDFIIIDGAPRIYNVARSAIIASNLVVIPIQPSPYDIWAATELTEIIDEVSDPFNELQSPINVAFLVNRKINNTIIGKQSAKSLEAFNINILDTHIIQRVAYAESASKGSTVIEDNIDMLAKKEFYNLTQEILEKYYYTKSETQE